MKLVKGIAGLAVLLGVVGVVFNQGDGKEKKPVEKKVDKPATHKVAAKPFKIELVVNGILTSEETAEVRFQPQTTLRPAEGQSTLTLRKIVEHGTAVQKGDVLAVLDTTKLNEVIDDLEVEQKTLLTSLQLAEKELPLAESAAPIELLAAENAQKRAEQELKYFLDVGKAQTEKEANMMVKAGKFMLEYAQEELAQLKKMYKSNDLTEETEKMILRRQQNWVDRIIFYLDAALLERDHTFKYGLPDREKSLRDAKARNDLLFERASKTTATALAQRKATLAKMYHEHDRNAIRLQKFSKDRDGMTMKAPIDGIVYHGKFQRGHWSISDTKLVAGGTVSADDVFLTILKAGPSVVYITVDEKDVHLLKEGLQGIAKLTSQPDHKIPARVSKLSATPASPGKFAALVSLEFKKDDGQPLPGLACAIKFVPYAKKSALVIPTSCIDEEDGKDIVHVLTPAGKQELREVVRGRSKGDDTEILSGLRENDEVLLERSSAKKEKGGTP